MSAHERILNLQDALNCLKALYWEYDFDPADEKLFEEDVKYSLQLIQTQMKIFK